MITGLLPPSAGQIVFDGRILSPALAQRSLEDLRELQMIYQMADTAMNPRQTVGTIIGRPLEFYFGLKGKAKQTRIQELLDEIELGDGFQDRYPAELSGGQKQRVGIARALSSNPKVLLCDEVTSALDPETTRQILTLLKDINKRLGLTMVVITHEMAVVKALCDRVAVMYAGRIVEMGTTEQVLHHPAHPYTKRLIDCVPRLGEPDRRTSAIPGLPPAVNNLPTGCAFADRCDRVEDACRVGSIAFDDLGEGHGVRCIKPMEGADV